MGLSVAALWLIQILTGVLLTFRMEIDNFLLGGSDVPLETVLMERRIHAIQAAGGTVSSVWVTNFAATRFDVLYADSEHHERKMRVDGRGRILRDGSGEGGFFPTLTDIHTTLLLGDPGKWIIAVSGVLLFSNVIVGLKLAWPRRGQWKRSLALRTSRNAAANLYGLHRTLGLYIGLPLLVLVFAGITLCFDDDLEVALHLVREPPVSAGLVGAVPPPAPGVTAPGATALVPGPTNNAPARVLDLALARFPGATLTALSMPTPEHPWYRVRLHVPGEVSRLYGQTAIYLSATDGTILREYSAAAAPPARLALDWIYPVHTAEAGGIVARLILVCVGLALLTMGYFGIRLWNQRRA
jgi:uncharacterized iron-regulated membrane protein